MQAEQIVAKPYVTGNKKLPKRDDELWKGILEDIFEDFLRFFFPDADDLFNMKKKFSFLDKEFNRLFPPEKNTVGVRYLNASSSPLRINTSKSSSESLLYTSIIIGYPLY